MLNWSHGGCKEWYFLLSYDYPYMHLQGFFPVVCLKAVESEVYCVVTLTTTVCEIRPNRFSPGRHGDLKPPFQRFCAHNKKSPECVCAELT